jgi:hypothetical protein
LQPLEGPKTGERVEIDWAATKEFQGLGDAKCGKVIYDFFDRPYKFKPGTDGKSIPVYDFCGNPGDTTLQPPRASLVGFPAGRMDGLRSLRPKNLSFSTAM